MTGETRTVSPLSYWYIKAIITASVLVVALAIIRAAFGRQVRELSDYDLRSRCGLHRGQTACAFVGPLPAIRFGLLRSAPTNTNTSSAVT